MADPFIYLVAAETSGDYLGAELARALKDKTGGKIRLEGLGGKRMAAEGIVSPFDISEISVLGYFEAIAVYRRVIRRADEMADRIAEARPDAVVLIDSWGFSIRLADRIRARNPKIRLIKYVGPQVFSIRPGPAKTLGQEVDQLLTIHAFDAPFYEPHGLKTTFVGSPALWRSEGGDGPAFRQRYGLAPADRALAVLFGSRRGEILRLYDPFEGAVARLREQNPDLRIIIPLADSVSEAVSARLARSDAFAGAILVAEDERHDAFAASTMALACSGTITSELALAGVPAVVSYRVHPATAVLMRLIFTTKYVSLVNIAAGEELYPELLQEEAEQCMLAEAVGDLLNDSDRLSYVSRRVRETALMMKGEGEPPSQKAAEAILSP